MKLCRTLLILFLFFSLCACTKWGNDEEHNPYEGMTEKQLYDESKAYLAKKEYESAIKRLEALETMYPFNNNAQQAEIDLIYAYYQKEDYPSAAATAERYSRLYPRAKNVDYAYYMKGLANFQQTRGTLAGLLPLDESWRDPGSQSQAYSDFATLVQQFPNSRYKANALQRMIYLRNLFAQRELNVAKYYYERNMNVAAVERANYLIKTYPQAPSTKAALALIYHGNMRLGLKEAANNALSVYQATYHAKPGESEFLTA